MPKTKHKGWFKRCVKGVKASGSAADPQAVCGAVLKRKRAKNPKAGSAGYDVHIGARKKHFDSHEAAKRHALGEQNKGVHAVFVIVDSATGERNEYSRSGRKRNPEAGAVAMREKFTGLPADSTVVVSRTEHVHEHLAALGDLIELRGKTIKGQPFVIEFKRSKNPRRKSKDIVSKVGKSTGKWLGRRAASVSKLVKGFSDTWINGKKRRNPNGPTILASNEAGTHLFIEGGDQSLDLSKVGLADQAKKETAIVGDVHYITYHARKKFDGKEEEHDYEHEFSEESKGPRPSLRYDVKNKAMFLDGGVYYVPRPFFGTSPGITD